MEEVWVRIHRVIEEGMNANGMVTHPNRVFNSWDNEIQKIWPGIKLKWMNDGGCGVKLKVNRKEVKWRPPNKDWIKINFDGASKGNPGKLGR